MIRKIESSDKKEVLQISSQIWEGEDYITDIFDEWVKGENSIFAGYWEDNKLIGFGRMQFLTPTDVWLEALRKDPQTKIKGVGYKIALYYLEQLKGKKIDSVRFSTYFGNIASIKLNENLGFNKVLTLSLKELKLLNNTNNQLSSKLTNNIKFNEIENYISNSSYLKGMENFIANGWVVQEYSQQRIKAIMEKGDYTAYLDNTKINGTVLYTKDVYRKILWINIIEADNEFIFKELINFTINAAIKENCDRIQVLIPDVLKLMNLIDYAGFTSWEQNNDFLLYEMPKQLINKILEV